VKQQIFSAIFLFVISALTGRSSLADAPSPLDIFAKHEAAIGYSLSDGNLKPYVLETQTTWRENGASRLTTTVGKHAGVYYFVTRTQSGVSRSFGFDGRGFWNANINGNVWTDIGYSRQFDVTWAVIEAEAFDSTLKPELEAPTATDDVVRIHPNSGVPADVFFNTQTYYIDKVIVDPGRENDELDYGAYERRGPVTVATSYRNRTGTAATTVTKFLWNAQLVDTDFHRPTQRNYTTFPKSGSTTLTFDTKAYPGIVIAGSVDGVPGKFLIDTGASGIFLSQSFAKKAGIQTFGSSSVEGVCGRSSQEYAHVQNMNFGGVSLDDITATVNGGEVSSNFDGLVGFDLMNQVVFAIDFDKKAVTISNPETFTYAGPGGTMAFGLDGGIPQIQATVDQRLPVYMDLDLGDSSSLTFTQTFLDANPGIIQGLAVHYNAGGKIGTAHIGNLPEIAFGPADFYGLFADALLCNTGMTQSKLMQGLIGFDTLRRFNLTFDYRSTRVYMNLNEYGNETKFGK